MKIHKHLEHTRHAMPYWLVAMLDALQPTQPLVRLGPFHDVLGLRIAFQRGQDHFAALRLSLGVPQKVPGALILVIGDHHPTLGRRTAEHVINHRPVVKMTAYKLPMIS